MRLFGVAESLQRPEGLQLSGGPAILEWTSPGMNSAAAGGTNFSLVYTAVDPAGIPSDGVSIDYSSDDGVTFQPLLQEVANTGAAIWSVPPATNIATIRFRLRVRNNSGTDSFLISERMEVDSTPPVFAIGALVVNEGTGATSSTSIPVSFTASDPAVNGASSGVTSVCFKTTTAATPPAAPAATDPCFAPLSSSGDAVTITDASAFLGVVGGSYVVYAWLRDRVGNVSALSAGTGTPGRDKSTAVVKSVTPAPTLRNVFAANVDAMSLPPTNAQLSFTLADRIYVLWEATATGGASIVSVEVSTTTNDLDFEVLDTQLANSANGGCTLQGAATGCYLSASLPSLDGVQFKVQVAITDSNGVRRSSVSHPFNTAPFRILAGNTDVGIGNGAAATPIMSAQATTQQMVVRSNGDVYFLGTRTIGLFQIKQSDGVIRNFIPVTGASGGDGGPVASATLHDPLKIALDPNENLLIFDRSRIRRVDFSTLTIDTLIGGGTIKDDEIPEPLDLEITPSTLPATMAIRTAFHVLPNGQMVFHAEEYGSSGGYGTPLIDGAARVRVYTPGQGITTLYPSGTGHALNATQDLALCSLLNFVPVWNRASASIQKFFSWPYHCNSSSAIPSVPAAFGLNSVAAGPHPPEHRPAGPIDGWFGAYSQPMMSLGGQLFLMSFRQRIVLYDVDTNTWVNFAGTGTAGTCVDGTHRLACNLTLSDAYLAKNGQMYFLELGRIRTFDGNGNVVTLYGLGLVSGDGGSALSARFSSIGSIQMVRKAGADRVYLHQGSVYAVKRVVVDGDVATIAGAGTSGCIAAGSATAVPFEMANTDSKIRVDPAGDYLFADSCGRVYRLDLATGLWASFVGQGATNFTAGDGLGNAAISGSRRPAVMGVNAASIAVRMSNGSDAVPADYHYKSYPIAGGNQAHLVGVSGVVASSPQICDTATAVGSCAANVRNLSLFWDSTSSTWRGVTPGRTIFSLGAQLTTHGSITQNLLDYRAWAHRRTPTAEYIFYCAAGTVRRKVVGGADTLAFTLPTGVACSTAMDYSVDRDTLVFTFTQNGYFGVAEIGGLAP